MKKHSRFNREVYLFPHNLTGAFAKWAVTLSPYTVPENLEVAIEKFHGHVLQLFKFDAHGMVKVSLNNLTAILEPAIEKIPEVAAWNDRKNGRDGGGFSSRFSDKPDPDDDFIDLGALARNITCEFATEADSQCWLDQNREEISLDDIPIVSMGDFEGMLCDKKH